MKIFVTGATGFIGSQLTKSLVSDGHEVTALTRDAAKARSGLDPKVRIVEGYPLDVGPWLDEIGRHDAIVNLCGEAILKDKWTPARKQTLLDSRLKPTRLIVEAMERAKTRPKVLISGSAIGYYGSRGDELLTEDSSPGDRGSFDVSLVTDWEEEAQKAEALGVRVVTIRTGIVLGRRRGALAEMAAPFKFFAGGPIGNGRHYMSWIHIDDHIGITKMALIDETISGGINVTAPAPVINRDFMKAIGKALNRPSWLPVPAFVLKLVFGEGAVLLVEGQRVLPKKAQDAGYKFRFTDVDSAVRDALGTSI